MDADYRCDCNPISHIYNYEQEGSAESECLY